MGKFEDKVKEIEGKIDSPRASLDAVNFRGVPENQVIIYYLRQILKELQKR